MSDITICKISVTEVNADCVVNAANSSLAAGSGVCGAMFEAAGYRALTEACAAIGHCDTGSAVITPGFRLKAKYIIHAVGPVWQGGGRGEETLLCGCYGSALELALENGCHSIAFPLISAGIFGYPKQQAWEAALRSCRAFLRDHPGCDMKIVFAVLDDRILQMGQTALARQQAEEAKPRQCPQ